MSTEHRERPLQVIVFGAGIAGLTAAHELAERGFDVEVYEKAPPSPWDRISTRQAACSIGGMARTQWTQTTRRFGPQRDGMQPTGPITVIDPVRIELGKPTTSLDAEGLRHELEDPKRRKSLESKLKRVHEQLRKVENAQIEVRGFCDAPVLPKAWDYSVEQLRASRDEKEHDDELLDQRPDLVFAAEVAHILIDKFKFDPRRLHLRAMGLGRRDDWTRSFRDRNFVEFVVREDWLPGEHGFRFFPAFYRHLFDTMRRTPIANEAPRTRSGSVYQESDRTVLDNIIPTEMMGMRTSGAPAPFGFKRSAVGSLEEIFEQGIGMLKAMGFPLADLDRFHAKLFKYMTSCPERRAAEYEHQTWWEFLDAERFSPEFRHYLDTTAEALVAMNARKSDARTYGNISVQMFQDQFSSGERTDGTLNGPTSLAWFDHWRRYLEYQGVKFHQGELVGFAWQDGRPWPVVERAESGKPKRRVLGRDYFVVALPVMEMSKLARKVVDDIDSQAKDLPRDVPRDFRALCEMNWGDPTLADPGGSVDHMAGIQFFFDGDLKILHGHILYPDTPWRLSAVGQPQFWRAKRGWWSGYRGILSVDISNWHEDGGAKGPGIAWGKTRQQIAEQVWKQICDSGGPPTVDVAGRVKHARTEDLPKPTLYHIDENIVFGKDGRPERNLTPLLINRKSEFARRPGIPGRYDLHFGCLVLAGTYMQTHTRLTTMESANESARHAVNAILRAERFEKEEYCMVSDPEDHEPANLRMLVELDRKLFAYGLPHFTDILDMRNVPRELLRAAPDLSALGLAERIQEVAGGRASR